VVFYCVAGSIVVMVRTDKTKMGNRKGAAAQTQGGKRMRVLGAFNTAARSADGASTSSTSTLEAPEVPEVLTSQQDVSQLTVDSSFDTSVSERSRETVGVSGEEFLSGRHDFRAFGRATWRDLVDSGVVVNLWAQLTAYSKGRTAYAKAKVLVSADELALSFAAQLTLEHRVQAVRVVLMEWAQRYEEGRSMCKITTFTEDKVAPMLGISGKRVRRWVLQFIVLGGQFAGVAYKCKPSHSIITDGPSRAQMTQWMVTASRAKPPAKAADFAMYVNTAFNTNIKERAACIWLSSLGFRYKAGTAQEIYNDGHQRADVKAALELYIQEMQELTKKTVTYAGVNMDRVVIGEYLQNNTAHRHIISYHDECSAHAADCERRRWCISGKGGKMGDKSRGPCRMVAAYVSDAVGLWTESKRIIEPGIAENKDDYWGGEDTFAQAGDHLLEFDRRYHNSEVCVDVYDNSSGHNCKAKDGLDVGKMNVNPGGAAKEALIIHNGTYLGADGAYVEQPMFF
jgi:transposase